jgi:hypothetical protein
MTNAGEAVQALESAWELLDTKGNGEPTVPGGGGGGGGMPSGPIAGGGN